MGHPHLFGLGKLWVVIADLSTGPHLKGEMWGTLMAVMG